MWQVMSNGVINPLLLLHHSQLATWASWNKNCGLSIFHLFSTSRLNNSDVHMPRLFSPSLNFNIKKTNIKICCQVFCLSSKVHLDCYKCKHHGRWVVRPFFFTKKGRKRSVSSFFCLMSEICQKDQRETCSNHIILAISMDPSTIKVPFSFSLTLMVNKIHDTITLKNTFDRKECMWFVINLLRTNSGFVALCRL